MTLIRRYVFRAVFFPALITGLMLMGLDGLFRFVDELQSIGGNYQALQALEYVVVSMPERFTLFLPIAILIGALFGLGLLANSGELVVIRTAGPSLSRLCGMVLYPVIILLMLGMLVGEFVAPYTHQVATSNRTLQQGGGEIMRSDYGYWLRQDNNFVHLNAVQPNGVLYGVTRLIFNDAHHLVESEFIDRAVYQGEGNWALQGIQGSRIGPDKVVTYQQQQGSWHNNLTPERLSVIIVDPDALSLARQWEYANYLQKQGLTADEYLLSFWQKLFMPLATIGMVLIAISFIFGPLREVSMGGRLTAGIIAGLLFHYGQQFFGSLSLVFHTSPFVAGVAPPAICVMVGIWLLRRVR